MFVGGYSTANTATAEMQELAQLVQPEIQAMCDKTFSVFEVVKYSQQIVAGMNYKLKIKVGEDKSIHAVVFRGLPHTGGEISVTSVEEDKTLDDAI